MSMLFKSFSSTTAEKDMGQDAMPIFLICSSKPLLKYIKQKYSNLPFKFIKALLSQSDEGQNSNTNG